MRLRWAVILLALLPLVLASVAVSWVVAQRSRVLAELNLQAVQPVLLAARRAELQSYLNLARSSIAHLVRDGMPDARAQGEALDILRRLEFGHDGYFFVIDFDGRVLVYPRQPQLVGQNLSDLQDGEGDYPVRRMLAQARAGGGHLTYQWTRPSTGQMESKSGYVEPIAGWEWMLGTGTYVDEPERARRRIATATESAVADTLWRVGIIAVLSTLVVVAAALMINLNEQRQADARLRAMAGQIVTTQEDERARVARELHDGVSQSLVSAKYVFESALERVRSNPAVSAESLAALDAGIERLRSVLGELRRISHALRPALLDDMGLEHALQHLAREWSQRNGVGLELAVDTDGIALPEAVSTAIFRVTQEALANVEHHAQAQKVTLSLQRVGRGVVLELQDNGQGFDADRVLRSPRTGLGLTHMRERIESLGGRFVLSSSALGTWLRAEFAAESLT